LRIEISEKRSLTQIEANILKQTEGLPTDEAFGTHRAFNGRVA